MMTPMRTIIELPHTQLEGLDALCRRERISRAEAIRQAVAAHISRVTSAARTSVFGLWRDRQVDGLTYERRLRREWASTETRSPAAPKPRNRRNVK